MKSGQMHVVIHLLDTVGIGACIVGKRDRGFGAGADYAGLIVEVGQKDRDVAGGGDFVVAELPFMDGFAGSFRADDKKTFRVRTGHFVDDAHHHPLRVLAVHREGAEVSEDRAERPEEGLFLDHDLEAPAQRAVVEITDDEVVDAGVGRGENDGLVYGVEAFAFGCFPTEDLIEDEFVELGTH